MIDIVERLRFDSARCELQFSKGVAGNIDEAADEIERLRATLRQVADGDFDDVEPDDGLHTKSVRAFARSALQDV